MNTLEKDDIYKIHETAIEEFGGFDGIYDYTDAKIESILSQQYPCFGYEKYPSVFQKSSSLAYFFVKGHCFRDGNKRVGLYVMEVFLNINGYELMLDNEDAEQLILEIASSEYRNEEIDSYIFKLADVIKANSRII